MPVFIHAKKARLRRAGKEIDEDLNLPLRSRLVGALVFVMYYLFPGTVIGLFKTFHCTEAIGETFADAVPRYLMSDLSVTCYEDEHLASVWIAIGLLIFYIVAVPGAIGYITRKANRGKLHTKAYRMKYGFLYNGYEDGREWWEVCVLARKTVIAVVLVYFSDPFVQSFAALFVLTLALYAVSYTHLTLPTILLV